MIPKLIFGNLSTGLYYQCGLAVERGIAEDCIPLREALADWLTLRLYPHRQTAELQADRIIGRLHEQLIEYSKDPSNA